MIVWKNTKTLIGWAACVVVGVGMGLSAILAPSACSLTSLDHLQGGGHRGDSPPIGVGGSPGSGGADSGPHTEDGSSERAESGPVVPITDGGGEANAGGSSTTAMDARAEAVVGSIGGLETGIGGATPGTIGGTNTSGSGGTYGEGGAGVGAGGSSVLPDGSAGGAPGMVYGIQGQSCAGLTACPGGTSCCARIEVPKLPQEDFKMGTDTDPANRADEKPEHPAHVDSFLLDQFEVTVGRFRRFVEAFDGTMPAVGAGEHPKKSGSGWQVDFQTGMPSSQDDLINRISCNVGGYQTWTGLAGANETLPINCASWYIAFAFCIWDGGRLPTEAEWEKAAAGGAEHRRFPWGNTDPNPETDAVMDCLATGTADAGCQPTDLLPVGSRRAGAGRWGHLDLAGNLPEWALDHYDDTYYQSAESLPNCENCINLLESTPRVVRGGSFTSKALYVRATSRASRAAAGADPYTGFRCARSP
jgi:formylglycine-generating enzyme